MSETSVIALRPGETPAIPESPNAESEYWYGLIDERAAADFLGLTDRTLQTFRYRGDGALYVAVSSRCIRYRRIDLKAWADERLRSSTADNGPEAA